MSRIVVFNQKGGVGKTTTSLNLAAALSQHQHHPVAIDMDPQAHLTHNHQLGLKTAFLLFMSATKH